MIDAYAAIGTFRSHRLASRSRVGSVDLQAPAMVARSGDVPTIIGQIVTEGH
jgi:hypothetical protein